jgi:hypothetical protein
MIQALKVDTGYTGHKPERFIQVFYDPPTERYAVITVVTGQDTDMDDALEIIQENASKVGADAVILRRGTPFTATEDEEIVLVGEAIVLIRD